MAVSTPRRINLMGKETRERLERCWDEEIDWDLYPKPLKEVQALYLASDYLRVYNYIATFFTL